MVCARKGGVDIWVLQNGFLWQCFFCYAMWAFCYTIKISLVARSGFRCLFGA